MAKNQNKQAAPQDDKIAENAALPSDKETMSELTSEEAPAAAPLSADPTPPIGPAPPADPVVQFVERVVKLGPIKHDGITYKTGQAVKLVAEAALRLAHLLETHSKE